MKATNDNSNNLKAIKNLIGAYSNQKSIAERSMYGIPDFALQAELSYSNSRLPFIQTGWKQNDNSSLNLSIGFKTTLWDGGKAINNLNRAKSNIRDAESQYDSALTQIRSAVISNYNGMKKNIADIEYQSERIENTNIVDGVPEGWEKKKVDSIYSIKYGKNLSTKLITETGLFPVYGANGVIGYYDKANCNEQVVLITSRGNGSGDVLVTYHKDSFITNNSFVVTPLEGYEYCKLPFTFQFLKMANFRAVRTGAAQPQV